MHTDTSTVTIAGRDVRLRPFSGRRAFAAMRIVARIQVRVDDVQIRLREFGRRWAESAPPQRITRQMAWYPNLPEAIRAMTAEDWERLGGYVEIPSVETPPTSAVLLELLPVLIDAAENEVLELMALAACSNDEYGAAVINGNQTDVLDAKRRELLGDDVAFGDLVALADAVAGFAWEQLRGMEPRTGNLRRLLGMEWTEPTEATPAEASPAPTSTTEKPVSSTESPAPTDGTRSESSTESPTAVSSATSG